MNFIKLLLLLPFLFSFANPADGQRETVNEISYSSGGGRGGGYFILIIRKDYTTFESGSNGYRNVFGKPTNADDWKRLSKVSLKAFDKIISSERTAEVDGTDVVLTIATSAKAHEIINGDYRNSKKMRLFVAALNRQMADIAVTANRKYPE